MECSTKRTIYSSHYKQCISPHGYQEWPFLSPLSALSLFLCISETWRTNSGPGVVLWQKRRGLCFKSRGTVTLARVDCLSSSTTRCDDWSLVYGKSFADYAGCLEQIGMLAIQVPVGAGNNQRAIWAWTRSLCRTGKDWEGMGEATLADQCDATSLSFVHYIVGT
jgi:hypothetical protein